MTKVVKVEDVFIGVDTPENIVKVEKILKGLEKYKSILSPSVL